MNKLTKKNSVEIKIKKKDFIFLTFLFLFLTLLIMFRVDPLGSFSLAFVALITFYFSKKYNSLTTILYVALVLRLITILLGNYLITLPDSWGDATEFERRAWEWSQNGFFEVFKHYPSNTKSYHISWILAFVYSLTDRSVIMAQSICLLFGIGSVLLGSRVANQLWNEKISIKVGWLIALYPTLILYSGIFLRESFIWFFLLIALYGISLWMKNGGIKPIMFILIGFFGATFFHGAMSVGLIVFLIIFLIIYFKQFFKNFLNLKINQKNFISLFFIVISISFILLNIGKIPKLDALSNILDYEQVLVEIENRNIGNALYPDWTVPKNFFELIYKSPIRIIYFLFSPFPWDISKVTHLMGLLDGLFHLILFSLLIKNFKYIWNDNTLRVIFLILISYLLIYGLSTGNFGTGIRHRAKFVIILFLLVSPWLPNFVFNKKRTRFDKK